MEENENIEPSPEYLKGVNQGYYIHSFKPELVEAIKKSNAHPDYLDGFNDSGMLYEQDRIRKEFDMIEGEKNLDRDQDRGIEY